MAGIDANAGQLDAAIGAFLGACTGDAAGAVLEFSQDASQGYVPLERVRRRFLGISRHVPNHPVQ